MEKSILFITIETVNYNRLKIRIIIGMKKIRIEQEK